MKFANMNQKGHIITEREHEILVLLSRGLTSPQIAKTLSLSTETIQWYRKQLLAKFSASTSAEVVRKAVEMKIL